MAEMMRNTTMQANRDAGDRRHSIAAAAPAAARGADIPAVDAETETPGELTSTLTRSQPC
jgi:hypothetical protein